MRPINKISGIGMGHGPSQRPGLLDRPPSFSDHVLAIDRMRELRGKKKFKKKIAKFKAQWKKVVGTL
jgi:hypothetical protein